MLHVRVGVAHVDVYHLLLLVWVHGVLRHTHPRAHHVPTFGLVRGRSDHLVLALVTVLHDWGCAHTCSGSDLGVGVVGDASVHVVSGWLRRLKVLLRVRVHVRHLH